MSELDDMGKDDPEHPRRPSGDEGRERRRGGGRPKEVERQEGLETMAECILEAHSAGSPTDENVRWTDLKPLQLARELVDRGFEIGRNTAAKLLDRAGFRRHSLRKELITGYVDPYERDQQFRHIDELRRHCLAVHVPSTELLIRIAELFNVSLDYLAFDNREDLQQAHIADRDLLQKLEAIDRLTEADKTTVKAVLDTFILKNRFQQLASTHKEQPA